MQPIHLTPAQPNEATQLQVLAPVAAGETADFAALFELAAEQDAVEIRGVVETASPPPAQEEPATENLSNLSHANEVAIPSGKAVDEALSDGEQQATLIAPSTEIAQPVPPQASLAEIFHSATLIASTPNHDSASPLVSAEPEIEPAPVVSGLTEKPALAPRDLPAQPQRDANAAPLLNATLPSTVIDSVKVLSSDPKIVTKADHLIAAMQNAGTIPTAGVDRLTEANHLPVGDMQPIFPKRLVLHSSKIEQAGPRIEPPNAPAHKPEPPTAKPNLPALAQVQYAGGLASRSVGTQGPLARQSSVELGSAQDLFGQVDKGAFDLDIGQVNAQLKTSAMIKQVGAAPQAVVQSIAQQLGVALKTSQNGITELVLNPSELGRVEMRLTTTETGVTVHITAERTETQDLMRRHLEGLVSEFKQMGFRDVGFAFQGNQHRPPAEQSQDELGTPEIEDPLTQSVQHVAESGDGLDLRL